MQNGVQKRRKEVTEIEEHMATNMKPATAATTELWQYQYPAADPPVACLPSCFLFFVNWRLSWWVPVAGGGEGGGAAPRVINSSGIGRQLFPLFLLPPPSSCLPLLVVMLASFFFAAKLEEMCSCPRSRPPPYHPTTFSFNHSFITCYTHGQ